MSVGNIDPSSSDPCRPGSQDDRHRVQLAASRIGSTTVIAGRGEVDACNAHDVAAYVVSHLDECNQLCWISASWNSLAYKAFQYCTM